MNRETMKKIIVFAILILPMTSVLAQTEFKVYENSDFQIHYPANWDLSIGQEGTECAVLSPQSSEDDPFRENVNVLKSDLKGASYTLDQIVKENIKTSGNKGFEFISVEKYKKDALEYQILSIRGAQQGYFFDVKQIFAVHKGYLYLVTYTAIENDLETYKKDADKVLKSFKLK